MAVSDVVKDVRKKLGKTQAQMGGDLGVTKQCISLWELGNRLPDLAYLINMTVIYTDWRRDFALRCIDAIVVKEND